MDSKERKQLKTAFPEELLPLAYSLAASYSGKGLALDELRQEALIGLFKATEHYDPQHQTKFSTYAVYWIKKQILEALEKESRHSLQACSLEQNPKLAQISSPEPIPETKASLRLPADLPELEQQILRLSLEQKLPLKEIGDRLGISTERCKQIKLKALRRIRCSYSVSPLPGIH